MNLPRPVLALLALPLLATCRDRTPPVRIGVLIDGAPAPSQWEGVQLAVMLRNAAGGVVVNGVRRRVELVSRPITDATDAAARFADLARDPAIIGIVAPVRSDHAASAAAAAERIHVPLICSGATSVRLTAGRRWVFRNTFNDRDQTTLLARYARDSVGAARAVIVVDTTSGYARDIGAMFVDAFEQRGGRDSRIIRVGRRGLDPAHVAAVAGATGAGTAVMLALYIPALTDAVRDLRAAGVDAPIFTTDAWPALSQRSAGPGIYFVRYVARDTPSLQPLRDYLASHARATPLPQLNFLSFEAATMLLDAVEGTRSATPQEVQAVLRSRPPQEGIASRLDFSRSGDPDATFAIATQTPSGARILWQTTSRQLALSTGAHP